MFTKFIDEMAINTLYHSNNLFVELHPVCSWEEKAMTSYLITTFYKFVRYDQARLSEIESQLESAAEKFEVKGLMILGAEGLNATVCAQQPENLTAFKQVVRDLVNDQKLLFKDSSAPKPPFRMFKIKQRSEIVTLGTPDLVPGESKSHHLTPDEWNRVLKEEDVVLIDTRNWYETKIGTSKNALDPKIEQFTEFPEWFKKQEFPKDKKVLIFCTGGIRCEKGLLEIQRQGHENVYQLDGGILKYLEEYPNDQFTGECFVFDHRVAVDQNLQPTQQYGLCPHCGQPSDDKVECKRCDHHTTICVTCAELAWKKDTCSKNCAYQYQLHPNRKGPHQVLLR